VSRHLVVSACTEDVVPKLLTFLLAPAIRPLVDRNNELGRLLQELQEFGFGRFHGLLIPCGLGRALGRLSPNFLTRSAS
jgi:hypothetical protein